MKTKLLFLVLTLLFLVGCDKGEEANIAEAEAAAETETETETETEPTTVDPVLEMLNTMTVHEKAAQLIIAVPEELTSGSSCVIADRQMSFEEYPVGGVILFAKNIQNPNQLKELLQGAKGKSKIPLFICVDEEGGSVARIAQNSAFEVPRFNNMGTLKTEEEAFSAAAAIGGYLKEYGFNVDFAPVADVNTNPNNPIIGSRAFSNQPSRAAAMVKQAEAGFRSQGVISCLKHFPGHGDTKEDSHKGCAVTYKTWEEMQACELIPFDISADMIMAGHITAPNVTDDGLPASLSYEMLTERLRGELGYEGVIITDSMSMGAIVNFYFADKAAAAAIKAGADMLLMPQSLSLACEGIEQAVSGGEITEEQLDEHVLRVLRLKEKYGLIK